LLSQLTKQTKNLRSEDLLHKPMPTQDSMRQRLNEPLEEQKLSL